MQCLRAVQVSGSQTMSLSNSLFEARASGYDEGFIRERLGNMRRAVRLAHERGLGVIVD